jgi:hypothetical protein
LPAAEANRPSFAALLSRVLPRSGGRGQP